MLEVWGAKGGDSTSNGDLTKQWGRNRGSLKAQGRLDGYSRGILK